MRGRSARGSMPPASDTQVAGARNATRAGMERIGVERRTSRRLRHLAYGIAAAVMALFAVAALVVDLAIASVEAPRLFAVHLWGAATVVLGAAGCATVMALVRRDARVRQRDRGRAHRLHDARSCTMSTSSRRPDR